MRPSQLHTTAETTQINKWAGRIGMWLDLLEEERHFFPHLYQSFCSVYFEVLLVLGGGDAFTARFTPV